MKLKDFSKLAIGIVSLGGTLTFQQQVYAADIRTFCYEITVNQEPAYILGDVFRQGLLTTTNAQWNNANQIRPTAPPTDATRCDGGTPPPVAMPTAQNYLGNVTSKAKFLGMAAMACGAGAGISDQYFSIGDAIYYRNCNAGDQTGYVYFWGRANGNKSQCFGSTYPEMFAIADQKATPVTKERMEAIYRGQPAMATQSDFALGNAMAAIQIAEAARDYLVYPINYMLIEQGYTPDRIIAGRCPPNTPSGTCQNTVEKQNGTHPLAWGGAQAAMMTGGWGTNNGATSEFGEAFEAEATVGWLVFKNSAKKEVLAKNAKSKCRVDQTYANLPQNQQRAITAFFAPLFK